MALIRRIGLTSRLRPWLLHDRLLCRPPRQFAADLLHNLPPRSRRDLNGAGIVGVHSLRMDPHDEARVAVGRRLWWSPLKEMRPVTTADVLFRLQHQKRC